MADERHGYDVHHEGETYEKTDAHARPLIVSMSAILAVTVMSYIATWVLFKYWAMAPVEAERPYFTSSQEPPAPVLQKDYRAEYAAFKREIDKNVTGYGWSDRAADRVRIPVDRAIDIVAERGLPQGDEWKLRPGEKMSGGVIVTGESAVAAPPPAGQPEQPAATPPTRPAGPAEPAGRAQR
jgi:hypothetical protein